MGSIDHARRAVLAAPVSRRDEDGVVISANTLIDRATKTKSPWGLSRDASSALAPMCAIVRRPDREAVAADTWPTQPRHGTSFWCDAPCIDCRRAHLPSSPPMVDSFVNNHENPGGVRAMTRSLSVDHTAQARTSTQPADSPVLMSPGDISAVVRNGAACPLP